MQINDGRSGVAAHVYPNGHVAVLATTRSLAAEASELGTTFSIESGFLTITTGEKGVLKIHTHPAETHIYRIRLQSDAAVKWRIYNKATSDTFTVAGSAVNMNSGSGTTYDSHVYVGDNTATVTGGTLAMSSMTNANRESILDLDGLLISGSAASFFITAEGAALVHASVLLFTHDMDD